MRGGASVCATTPTSTGRGGPRGETVSTQGPRESIPEASVGVLNEPNSTLLEYIAEAFIAFDSAGRFTYVNPEAERILERPRETLLGRVVWDVFPEVRGSVFEHHYQLVLANRQPLMYEARLGRRGPWLEVRVYPRPDGIGVFLRDITARKQSEEALRLRDRALAASHSGILITDALLEDNPIIYCNPAFERITGYTADEVLGRNSLFLHGHDTDPEVRESIRQAMRQGQPFTGTILNYRKDGTPFWSELAISPIRDESGRVTHFVGVMCDVTEQRRALEAMRFQAHLLNIVDQAVIAVDGQGMIRYWNQYAEQLYGWSAAEVLGTNARDIILPDSATADTKKILMHLRDGRRWSGEFMVRRRDGTIFPVFVTTYPIFDEAGEVAGMVGVAVDISDRKRLEAQLIHAQRMESVGRLAGGVAHDFNNLLTAIAGYTSVIEAMLPPNHPVLEDVQALQQVAHRAGHLTRQLLAFARKQTMEPVPLNLNDLVADLGPIFRRLLSEEIELIVHPAPDLGVVRADPVQLEQVLVNLVVNARDAMPAGGKLTIETANVTIGLPDAERHIDLAPGNYVLITVSDTGSGMSPAVKEHAFEPFFTTKEEGRGTGLGLSTCYGVVKQHGGHIWFYSEEGYGTTFKIYLPRSDEQPGARAEQEARDALPVGSETVLVVEDEEMLRAIAARTLRSLGYTVYEAGSGDEALAIASTVWVDLLLTDVVMPQMRGDALAEQLQARLPHTKGRLRSGNTDAVPFKHLTRRTKR
nr:MAG: hybrid sensor histidine kinase/response regulator [Chloroflexota bacterium]